MAGGELGREEIEKESRALLSLSRLPWELRQGESVNLLLGFAATCPDSSWYLAFFGQDPGSGLPPQELSSSKVACLLQAFSAYILISRPRPLGYNRPHPPALMGVWMLVKHSSESKSYRTALQYKESLQSLRDTRAHLPLPLSHPAQGFVLSQCLTLLSENCESKLIQSPLASAK